MRIIKELSKYLGPFIFAVALIAVYKTFDNFGNIMALIKHIIALLNPFIIGFVIAYIFITPCNAIENFLGRRKTAFLNNHRRAIAVSAIYIVFAGLIVLAIVAIVPALVFNLIEFANNMPALMADFANWFNGLNLGVTFDDDTIRQLLNNEIFSIERIMTYLNFDNVNKYARGVISAGSGLFNIFMGIVISIYILIDRASLRNTAEVLFEMTVKEKSRVVITKYLSRINEFAHKYIYCMLVDAIIIFVASFIILSVEGVTYAPLFAMMLGLFNLIPYFGAITATVLTSLITMFTGSITQAVVALISMIVLQQLDANFIQPRLLSGSLKIKPFWVIFGILLGGGLFGIVGIFLAVPITALCRSIIIDIAKSKTTPTS